LPVTVEAPAAEQQNEYNDSSHLSLSLREEHRTGVIHMQPGTNRGINEAAMEFVNS